MVDRQSGTSRSGGQGGQDTVLGVMVTWCRESLVSQCCLLPRWPLTAASRPLLSPPPWEPPHQG